MPGDDRPGLISPRAARIAGWTLIAAGTVLVYVAPGTPVAWAGVGLSAAGVGALWRARQEG